MRCLHCIAVLAFFIQSLTLNNLYLNKNTQLNKAFHNNFQNCIRLALVSKQASRIRRMFEYTLLFQTRNKL